MWLNKLFLCVGLALLYPSILLADAYPWVDIHPGNVKIFENSRIEAKLRLRLIRKAKRVDIITYDQRADELVSMPLLEALRFAADRGAKVRFIRGNWLGKAFVQYYSERKQGDPVENFLTKPPTKNPIEYLLVGRLPMLIRGWSPFNGVHEKLIIIDGRIAFFSGRGQAAAYLDWLDTCHLVKGALVDQAQTVFNDIRTVLLRENGIREKIDQSPSSEEEIETHEPYPDFSQDPPLYLSSSQKKRLRYLKKWADQPALDPADLPEHLRAKGRLIHHDLLKQLRQHCGVYWFYNYHGCSKRIQDPIVDELLKLVQDAKEVSLYTLSIQLHPLLKQALIQRLQERNTGGREFQLNIFTNGKDAHYTVVPYPFGWFSGLPDLNDLMQEGAEVHTFGRNPTENSLQYLHRKGMIVTLFNGEKHYLSGSHNWSKASTYVNDELGLQFKGAAIASQEKERFERSLAQNGEELDATEIRQQQVRNRFIWPFGWAWKMVLNFSEAFF